MRLIDADTLTQKAQEIIGTEASYKAYAIMDAILTAPTVDVATGINVPDKWISVKSRMPDKNEKVIMYYEWTGKFSGDKYLEVSMDTLNMLVNLNPKCRPIAWMPLPEPPKEEN